MSQDIARFLHEMREGSRRQANVLFALIFKEIKSRSGTSSSYGLYNFAGIVLEPAIGVLFMAIFWYAIRRQEIGGVHIALFLAVSYFPFGIIRRSLTTIPRSLRGNLAFYTYQQVKPFDSVTAQFVMECTLMLAGGGLVLFGLWWFMGLSIAPDHVLEATGVLVLLMVTGYGLSLILGTYGAIYPVIPKVVGTLTMGLVIFSAVLHPLAELPPSASYILSWNPLANIEEKLRQFALGMRPDPNVTLTYPMGFALAVLFLGFTAYYANRLKVLER